jgi:hypothetical protein
LEHMCTGGHRASHLTPCPQPCLALIGLGLHSPMALAPQSLLFFGPWALEPVCPADLAPFVFSPLAQPHLLPGSAGPSLRLSNAFLVADPMPPRPSTWGAVSRPHTLPVISPTWCISHLQGPVALCLSGASSAAAW